MLRRKRKYVLVISICLVLLFYWYMDSLYENMHWSKDISPSDLAGIQVGDLAVDKRDLRQKVTTAVDKKDLRSSYLMKYQPQHFVIQDEFTLPMPRLTLPIYDLITKRWMGNLRNYLRQIPPHSITSPISIVSCDSKFTDVLINWLISATVETHPPLTHILVLSLDRPLHTTLTQHGFKSIHIDAKDLLSPEALYMVQDSSRRAFYVVMVMRLTVMRLMNHWGYSVANYDTDAIILKNPEQLFYRDLNASDVIGSRGKFPTSVKNVLGLTLCAGMFVTKSTPGTGIKTHWEGLVVFACNKHVPGL